MTIDKVAIVVIGVVLLTRPDAGAMEITNKNLPPEEKLSRAVEDQELIRSNGHIADVRNRGANPYLEGFPPPKPFNEKYKTPLVKNTEGLLIKAESEYAKNDAAIAKWFESNWVPAVRKTMQLGEAEIGKLRVAARPSEERLNVYENIVYNRLGERGLVLDLYTPKTTSVTPFPVVIFVHGGGWLDGSHRSNRAVAMSLAEKGFAGIAVEYRLGREACFPAGVWDVKAAVRWARKNAAKYHLDSSFITVAGGSAGGNIAGLVGVTNGDPRFEGDGEHRECSSDVHGIISLDGAIGTVSGNWASYPDKDPWLYNEATPLFHMIQQNRCPPLLFVKGGRPLSAWLATNIAENHSSHVHFRWPHGFECFDPSKDELVDLLAEYLRTVANTPAPQADLPPVAKGREYVYQMDPIPEGLISARFHLWIPDSVGKAEKIRGVIAQNGYNYGLMPEVFRAAHWRALASELGLALCLYRVQESDRKHAGSPGHAPVTINALEAGLEHFAQSIGRPELKHAGLIFTGLSASGRQAIFLGNAMAKRTIAVIVYSPATNLPHPLDTSVPVLINMGGLDLKFGNPINLDKNIILAARAQGAPWAGLYQANVPHSGHGEPSFVMDWTRAIVKLRVPEQISEDAPIELKAINIESGWLGKLKLNSDLNNPHPEGPDAASICAYADSNSAAASYWLPNETLAQAWKQYCLDNDVSFLDGSSITLSNDSFVNSVGMRMMAIPAGRFIMGSPLDEEKRADDEVQHEVNITKPFYIGATEVTQFQWQKVMGSNPTNYKADTNPVEQVSYDDALKFCKELSRLDGRNYRLPTEAEWEYACRAGTTMPFHYGWTIDTDIANYRGDVGYGGGIGGIDRRQPQPVAQFPPNDWGLYDMHGNVFEWCSDWYGTYPTGLVTDPKGPASGTDRVFRGGSWYNLPNIVRSAFRGMSSPSYTSRLVGLRVVCDGQRNEGISSTKK